MIYHRREFRASAEAAVFMAVKSPLWPWRIITFCCSISSASIEYWSARKSLVSLLLRLNSWKIVADSLKGIAFSGSVGIGFFITSGELIGISGSLGCAISFIFAGLIIIAVM